MALLYLFFSKIANLILLYLFNGGFAFRSYRNYFGKPHLPHTTLLSTSPACAGRDREKTDMWERAVRDALRGEL